MTLEDSYQTMSSLIRSMDMRGNKMKHSIEIYTEHYRLKRLAVYDEG